MTRQELKSDTLRAVRGTARVVAYIRDNASVCVCNHSRSMTASMLPRSIDPFLLPELGANSGPPRISRGPQNLGQAPTNSYTLFLFLLFPLIRLRQESYS